MLELVGYEVKEGIKRSTGMPYKLEILHLMGESMEFSKDCYGKRVETVVLNLLYSGSFPKYPTIGDKIRVFYGRTGYVVDYEVV